MNDTDRVNVIKCVGVMQMSSEDYTRQELESKHGQVWSTKEMQEEFDVTGFMAPLAIVRRKSDGAKGSLEFRHSPRFYFNWQPH